MTFSPPQLGNIAPSKSKYCYRIPSVFRQFIDISRPLYWSFSTHIYSLVLAFVERGIRVHVANKKRSVSTWEIAASIQILWEDEHVPVTQMNSPVYEDRWEPSIASEGGRWLVDKSITSQPEDRGIGILRMLEFSPLSHCQRSTQGPPRYRCCHLTLSIWFWHRVTLCIRTLRGQGSLRHPSRLAMIVHHKFW